MKRFNLKTKKIWTSRRKMIKDLIQFKKVILRKEIFFPVLFVVLAWSTPDFTNLTNYIVENIGRWSDKELSSNTMFGMLGFSVILLLYSMTSRKWSFGHSMLIGAVVNSLYIFLGFGFMWARNLNFWELYALKMGIVILDNLGAYILSSEVIGRFSSVCPDGLENFGVTVIVAFINLGMLCSGLGASGLIRFFNIYDGYYDRYIDVNIITWGWSILIVAISPILTFW